MQTFYPGQEGGTATAERLFGDQNFSGKLPFTVAQAGGEDDFGYGLSYTTYTYSNARVLCPGGVSRSGRLNAQVTVTNDGPMAGDEIVQLYVSYPPSEKRRPLKELKAFARVHIPAGESRDVSSR